MALPALPDRYEYVSDPVLGEGGMGVVYRARDRLLDKHVAIKVVRSELAADPLFRRLFDSELRAAARLAHPRIVPLHDTGELASGAPFLALAYADGGSVSAWVKRAPPWSAILRMALDLLEGLAFVHATGALHRDIKPANILLYGRDRRAWIADLGLADNLGELTRSVGRTEGTPGYMAPEQALGRAQELGPSTDLYSVGVVLWQLVTGRRPFQRSYAGGEAGELPPMVVREGLAVPAELDRILANMLAADPLSRYDLAADVATELRALGPAVPPRRSAARPPQVGRPVAPAASLSVSTSAQAAKATGIVLDGVPLWNRPLPPALPERVPSPVDVGEPGASVRLFTLRDPPLVGHQRLRQALWDAARAVRDTGEARVLVVRGAPGSGKSHLVRSVVRALHAGGWAEPQWLSYHRPADPADGFAGAVVERLRPWGADRGELERRAVRRLARQRQRLDTAIRREAQELAQWLRPRVDEPAVPDAVALRALQRDVEASSWRGLACLVLDDAELAVEPGDGLALAANILRGRGGRRLVYVTVGPQADLGELERLGAEVVEMPTLDRRGARELLDAWLPLEPAVADVLSERCGGDAGLARDVAMSWAERDWLVRRGPRVGLAPGVDPTAALPAGADALHIERLETLARQTAHPGLFLNVVHALSLVGRTMERPLFDALCGDLDEDLFSSGIVEELPGRVRFTSVRGYEAARSAAEQRDDVDACYDALLERVGEQVGPELRGRWALGAGDRFAACEWLQEAVQRALAAGRLGAAEVEAHELLRATEGREPYLGARGQAWLWWGRAALARGEYPTARDRLRRSLRRAEALEDNRSVLLCRVGLAALGVALGELDTAEEHLDEAERRAAAPELAELRAEVVRTRAELELHRRNGTGADVLFRRAERMADERDDLRGVGAALLGQARLQLHRGDLKDADATFDEARRIFERSRDPVGAVEAMLGWATVLAERGAQGPADRALRRVVEKADRLGATAVALRARMEQARALTEAGELAEAEAAWRHLAAWAHDVGDYDACCQIDEALIWLALFRGDVQRAYEVLDRLAGRLRTAPGHEAQAGFRLAGAAYLLAAERADVAHGWLWEALELGLADRRSRERVHRVQALLAACERAPRVAELARRALDRLASPHLEDLSS